MATLNHVLLVGNLTRDVELRYTAGGSEVTDLGLAVNRTWNDKSGQKREEVLFINCTAWGKVAKAANNYLVKGSPVLVEGHLQSRDWEDKEGKKRTSVTVVVENLQFLSYKKDNSGKQLGPDAPAEVHAGDDEDVQF